MEELWEGRAGVGGKDGHELFEGAEGLSLLELGFFFDEDVREEGRVVEGVEPGPAGDSLVVVLVDPAQSLNVLDADLAAETHEVLGSYPELLPVVFLLVVKYVVAENGVVLQVGLLGYQTLGLVLERSQHVHKRSLALSLGNMTHVVEVVFFLGLLLLFHPFLLGLSLLLLEYDFADDVFLVEFHLVYEYLQRGHLHFSLLG